MKDYFALLTVPQKVKKPIKTEPSLPSIAPFDGNDGSVNKTFQISLSPKPYISAAGDLVIPFNSDRKYHYWRGGQSVLETLRELGAAANVIRKYESPLSEKSDPLREKTEGRITHELE